MAIRLLFRRGSNVRESLSLLPSGGGRIGQDCRTLVTSCNAAVLYKFGGPDVLKLSHVIVPDLKPNEVLVRTRAVSINPLDIEMRAGYRSFMFQSHLPLILGRDISGEVAAIGTSVLSFGIGEEVFGALDPFAVRGTYADYAILAEHQLTSKPASLSHVEASAIPFDALTAWCALRRTVRIATNERVLVIGARRAVGLSAIQLAVAAGCHVSAICEGGSIDRVLKVGANHAVDIKTEDLVAATEGSFDIVFDTIGCPQTERLGIDLLKRGGNYMTFQGETESLCDEYGVVMGIPSAALILLKKKLKYRYSHGIGYERICMRSDAQWLDEIRKLAEAGKLKIPVEKTFPISEVKEAHETMEKERYLPGKIVLKFD